MDEREFLYAMKRQVEDRIDSLDPAKPPPPIPIERRRLAVVVGHTAKSPGAYSKALDTTEYPWNRDLAQMMQALQVKHGVAVEIFYRDNGGIAGAYASAKQWDPDCIIELHFNAATPAATGTETLYMQHKPWAAVVQAHMVRCLGLPNRGVKTPQQASGGRGEASLLEAGDRPAVLVEPFFGSNPSDSLVANERKAKLADALVKAFVEFVN